MVANLEKERTPTKEIARFMNISQEDCGEAQGEHQEKAGADPTGVPTSGPTCCRFSDQPTFSIDSF